MVRAPVALSRARLCLTFLDGVNTPTHNRTQRLWAVAWGKLWAVTWAVAACRSAYGWVDVGYQFMYVSREV